MTRLARNRGFVRLSFLTKLRLLGWYGLRKTLLWWLIGCWTVPIFYKICLAPSWRVAWFLLVFFEFFLYIKLFFLIFIVVVTSSWVIFFNIGSKIHITAVVVENLLILLWYFKRWISSDYFLLLLVLLFQFIKYVSWGKTSQIMTPLSILLLIPSLIHGFLLKLFLFFLIYLAQEMHWLIKAPFPSLALLSSFVRRLFLGYIWQSSLILDNGMSWSTPTWRLARGVLVSCLLNESEFMTCCISIVQYLL